MQAEIAWIEVSIERSGIIGIATLYQYPTALGNFLIICLMLVSPVLENSNNIGKLEVDQLGW